MIDFLAHPAVQIALIAIAGVVLWLASVAAERHAAEVRADRARNPEPDVQRDLYAYEDRDVHAGAHR